MNKAGKHKHDLLVSMKVRKGPSHTLARFKKKNKKSVVLKLLRSNFLELLRTQEGMLEK